LTNKTIVKLNPDDGFWIIENKYLKVSINNGNGCFDVIEKTTETEWQHDPWMEASGELIVKNKYTNMETSCNLSASRLIYVTEKEGPLKGVNIEMIGPVTSQGESVGSITINCQLLVPDNDADLIVKVVDIKNETSEWSITSLRYPIRQFYLKSVYDDGYVVVPQGEGFIVPTRVKPGFYSKFNHRCNGWGDTKRVNMAWFGAVKGPSSYICIFKTPFDVLVNTLANRVFPDDKTISYFIDTARDGGFVPRICAVSPVWLMSFGKLGYERRMIYRFIPGGNYVTMAKYFREYVIEKGLFKSLKEKIKENPNIEKLIGAPWIILRVCTNRPLNPKFKLAYGALYDDYSEIHLSFKDIQRFIEDLHELGVERAHLMVMGWHPRGFDNLHPDVWPPNEEAGGVTEFARASEIADKYGYVFGTWDNYWDMYRDAPSYSDDHVVKKVDGTLMRGGNYDGGPPMRLCTLPGLDFMKRNIPTIIENIHPKSMYNDCIMINQSK